MRQVRNNENWGKNDGWNLIQFLVLLVQVLLNMLPAYHMHVKTFENTLITKFFGLHRIKPYGGQKVLSNPAYGLPIETLAFSFSYQGLEIGDCMQEMFVDCLVKIGLLSSLQDYMQKMFADSWLDST